LLPTIKSNKVYGNYRVLSPDNILIFRCDERKANWYLKKNLAEVDSSDPNTIILNFKPNGLGNHGKNYGLSDMNNRCVNCGSEEMLTRHHIVPYCYRKFLPEELKSHRSHDILPMCMDCHVSYERKADILKDKLSKKYNVPLQGKLHFDKNLSKVIKTSLALLNPVKIPEERIVEMRLLINDYLKRESTTDDILNLSNIKLKMSSSPHGKIIMRRVKNIKAFIKMWRKHFIDSNESKYIPQNWNINNEI